MKSPVAGWNGYVDFWREREAPDAYAVGRIVWGTVIFCNVLHQILYPGVIELYATPEHGGMWPFSRYGGVWPFSVGPTYSLFQFLEPTAYVVWGLVIANLVAAAGLTLGLFTRVMALALLVLHMTLTGRIGLAGYGGDSVVRVFSFLMVLAPLGASWSLDAFFFGGKARVPMWPRRLIIAQLTLLYVKTGVVKMGATWSFIGGHSALYYAVNDPSYARWDGRWAAWLYPLTQAATFVARWWETLFFVLPWSMYLNRPSERRGWLRKTLGRFDLRPLLLGVGLALHAGLLLTLDLGMFPWVTMALYPFFLRPSEARWLLERTLGERWRGVREPSSHQPEL